MDIVVSDIPEHNQGDFTHAPTLHLTMEIVFESSNAKRMALTFLNTTDAPKLSSKNARDARAHVTKINFKQRRQRLAIERLKRRKESTTVAQERTGSIEDACVARIKEPSISPQVSCLPADPDHSIRFFFPAQTGTASSPSEFEWIALLRSEPALVEACMYVALEHWPGGPCWEQKRQAGVHLCKTLSMVNSRLNSGQGLSDGVIGAVFVLTFGERLSKNEATLEIHLNGLSKMVNQRREQGLYKIPSWFLDLLLYDSIQEVIPSTPVRKERIVAALRKRDVRTLGAISQISHKIHQIRQNIEDLVLYPSSFSSATVDIEGTISSVQEELRPLFNSSVAYIASVSRAISLFLQLSWPSTGYMDHASCAKDLQVALSEPRVTLCGSTSLTVWQYFVGGVGAASRPSLRSWYVASLANIFRAMHIRDWEACYQVMEGAFVPDSILLMQFKDLWEEIRQLIAP
ncbi:unnamed protein product [Clonostachys chloroleuca]|uniref:Uncharacterized protein n=1 Tax=Clonostachys chloroleuca TaxID=1926264 RepID=A0AA35LTU7_9HYPO|nr:unnamed protein product [Clonostachys chloroleuca]